MMRKPFCVLGIITVLCFSFSSQTYGQTAKINKKIPDVLNQGKSCTNRTACLATDPKDTSWNLLRKLPRPKSSKHPHLLFRSQVLVATLI
jgi:hypothetical protein